MRLTKLMAAVAVTLFPVMSVAEPFLTVTIPNAEGETSSVEYSSEELLSLDATEIVTTNDYIEDQTTFTGPRLSTLVEAAQLGTDTLIRATALNDYSVEIPAEDIMDYDVIIAVLMDGKPMSVRGKGPYWVIYPMDENPELQDAQYNDRLIWQLASIEVVPAQ